MPDFPPAAPDEVVLPCSYNLVRPPDGSFGTRLPNGSGTGMVGMVSRQEVDLGLGPFGVTAARSLIIDYTTPVVNDYLRILAGRGRPEVDPWGFLLPLAPLVWVGLVVALVVVMAIVLLLARCLSLHSPALAPYVRVLLQENSWLPALWGWERLVLGGWMLAMLVVTQSYTGNLMSLLAVRYIPQPFQTLRALLDDSATTMIWEYGTASVNKFRTAEFGILREVGESEAAGRIMFVLATEYLNILRGLVRSGTHAFIGEDLTARVLMAQEFSRTGRCDFYASREVFMPFLFCMIGPKHSPLVYSVSKRITWITEAGLYNHWMDSLSSNWTVCERAPSRITVRTRLGLGNVWGMFAILVVGNALSLLLFLVEVLTGHHLHSLLTVTSSWT
ncbi:probable glutamate receptor isoform X2 [Scylla paramamosain]|uniref:probable glutamate receptor isoform X2 n=1 Tax=Scylla paramamosain TaxID=85552 RepID=UPI003082AE13